jgi:hypothetical protein
MAVIGIADVLSSDSDSTGQCVLALDQYETDYSMIRDCSTLLLDGTRLDRYSCKDPWKCAAMQDDMDREFSSRKRYIPFYDTWIAGQVHEVWPAYRHRVLHDSVCMIVLLYFQALTKAL